MTEITLAASYGYVYGQNNGSYDSARSTAYSSATNGIIVGQRYYGLLNRYYVYRGFLKFDTSSLSEEPTSVRLKLQLVTDYTDTDFDVQIVKYDWSSYDPLTFGNKESSYDGALAADADNSIWRNTSGLSTGTYYESGELSTSWVNISGNTYYALRSYQDANNTAPTGNEYLSINYAAAPPILIVNEPAAGGSSTPIHLIRTGMQPGMRIGL